MSIDWNILLVVPRTNLELADAEVTEIVNSLHPRLYQGHVTVSGIIDHLRERDQDNNEIKWDLIYVISHAHGDGIELSDQELLTVSTMTALVRAAPGARWFLNTCDTMELALRIHSQIETEFVFNVKQVPDLEAFLVAKNMAYHLTQGKSFYNAYLESRLGENSKLMYLPGDPRRNRGRTRMSDLMDDNRFEKMADELDRIVALIDGSARYDNAGIIPTMKVLGERQDRSQANIFFLRVVFALMMVINFFMLLAIVFLIYDI